MVAQRREYSVRAAVLRLVSHDYRIYKIKKIILSILQILSSCLLRFRGYVLR